MVIMWGEKKFLPFLLLAASFLVLLHHDRGLVTARASSKSPWLTLSGNAPSVVARGGFSGLFPDSSRTAYLFTYLSSSPDTVSWCDVQLTKDGVGLCLPTMLLDNCTNIWSSFRTERYSVNGVPTSGVFSVDYDFKNLSDVTLIQSIFSRSNKFDAIETVSRVEDVITYTKSGMWLNIQHDMFYQQHNLSMRNYLLALSKTTAVDFVSSPEIAFLRSIVGNFKRSKTKLVFRFMEEDVVEPSMNQTYGSLLKNLTFIKTFASGILIPKNYIWPVTSDMYLQPNTSIVLDAHKEGLEVFASDFANDASLSYNYGYDPLAEYLKFIDNGIFSVDGLLTDFPITASEAIGCFSHMKKDYSEQGKPIVITHNGASGVYPDCTDLAYGLSVEDGADYIDCPVQVTKDGILICMSSINLMQATTVATSPYRSRSTIIPEIQGTTGIYTFNLTWDEIHLNLKPAISSTEIGYGLMRNPRYKNAGKFMKLSDFLTYAKGKALSGVMISIENAAFLGKYLGYGIIDEVIKTLKDAGLNDQTPQEVIIQSTNSSVLTKLKQQTNYKLVYMVDKSISNADASSLADIKKFASYVAVDKHSIYPQNQGFIIGQTDLMKNLKSAGLSVFVYVLRNEFVSQPWDFFSDPTVEINAFVKEMGVDGIITEFPGTATRYKRNTCSRLGNDMPNYMNPVHVGDLLHLIDPSALPPAPPPFPVLDDSDVAEPLLPPVSSPKLKFEPSPGSPPYILASYLLSLVIAMITGSILLCL